MPPRTTIALLAALAMIATPMLPASAHSPDDPDKFHAIHEDQPDADTYIVRFRADEAFKIKNGSRLHVTASYPSNASTQDIAGMLGVVRYFSGSCSSCFISAFGDSTKDDRDYTIETRSPATLSVSNDPNGKAVASMTWSILWNQDAFFEGPGSGASQVTYRIFFTIPTATDLRVDMHMHTNKPIELVGDIAHDGGFLFRGSDYQPEAYLDTAAGSATLDGERIVNLPDNPDDRLYAVHSPSWYGTSGLFGSIYGTYNTLAVGNYGVEFPDGSINAGTGVAAFGPSGPLVLNAQDSGPYRFFVDAHAGLGPQDMYTVGFKGPLG